MGPGFCPKMGCGAMPRPAHLAGQRLCRRPDKCDAGRRPSGRRIPRPAASGRTRSLCRSPSSERTANPSSRRKRQDSLSLSLVLFPSKPLCWVSAGALLGAVIKTPISHFFGTSMWEGYHYPPAALSVSEQPGAGFISAEKAAFSEWVLCADGCVLFPPAHSAFSAFLHGGGITTLGMRFMLLKRWTPAGHGGVFTVFMPSRNSPCAG